MGSVAAILAAVINFSSSYIRREPFYLRFHLIVLMFVAAIFLLVVRPNIFRIILGWDGLGVTSYLLIIYFQRSKSFNAGALTLLTNRLGDVAILLSIGAFAITSEITLPVVQESPGLAYTRLVLLAAITKRAQIPFSAWLPAAIAAPTPVSALVHSSTLVTAGVYLLVRFSPLLRPPRLRALAVVGGSTILMAGVAALSEIDIKKVVALSTLSQLGLIVVRVGLGIPELAFFHLISHAYFKALLFIRVGNLIHLRDRAQDLRKSGIAREVRFTSRALIVGTRARLRGLPFLVGFFSKDGIIESVLARAHPVLAGGRLVLGAALTSAYSLRLVFFVVVSASPLALAWGVDSAMPEVPTNSGLFILSVARGTLLAAAVAPGCVPCLPGCAKAVAFAAPAVGLALFGLKSIVAVYLFNLDYPSSQWH